MNKLQAAKFDKIAEAYHLGEHDDSKKCLPIEKRYTPKEISSICETLLGNTSKICVALDCTRSQWIAFLDKHPDIKELCKNSREAIVDKAEARMLQAVNSENEILAEKASEFVLKTLGRSRGWGQDPST